MESIVQKRLIAELLGTFWLTFCGYGSAILAAAFPQLGIGFAGVSLAFGLTVLTMAYAVGGISGGHFNPAVTIGLWAGRRVCGADVLPYIAAQVSGAIVAAAALYLIANGQPGFAANGYGPLSPGHFDMKSAALAELIATFFFVLIIMRVTAPGAVAGFAPIAIGLALTLIHLVLIPVSNTSVNPARSTGPALFAEGQYLSQLWLFWLAPIAGGVMGALAGRALDDRPEN
ncbi:aquaporin Z [Pseudomonas fluorescens]|uniref:Aquaporin Z n=1 Tax=Pseudomonas fluorescens TaxID=294 RepID=A0A2N1DVD8_PSEFL|nr:aquaporin Z [Pseudomonas fluorescens]PKH13381.1 aquaporin Z [Pseudomonas fluorescens]